MCGICGVMQTGGPPREVVPPDVLDAMTDVMTHRGPNDRGTASEPGFALGVRRLSIVDVDGGHQPVVNERDTVVAVQNGELYNHGDLRRGLERAGHVLHSRCDTEILPHLYEDFGPAVPDRLRGKFGLAIWDKERRRGVLARDRLGVKPLYYAEVGDLVVFGSELKSVLASGLVPLELDVDAIDAFLTLGFVPGPLTPLRAVKKLLPGHRLVVDRSGARTEPYWTYPEPAAESPGWSDEDYAERLLAVVDDSVAARLMSDVPLGAMLSGGLDSSLVVALMARRMTEPVKTFTVGFAGTPDNELAAARAVARAFGTDHHELELSLDDPIDLEGLVWSLDEPVADLSALGFAALSELAAQHVTVALAGQGADELLAGYGRYGQLRQVERLARLPRPLRQGVAAVAGHVSPRARRAADLALSDDLVAASVTARSAWADVKARSARGDLAGTGAVLDRLVADRVPRNGTALERGLVLDGRLSLVDDLLHYFDRTSMAHSLEVRVPFLDHNVVEFCARVPQRLKLRGGTTKVLLRRVARGVVPDEVLDRPKVGFFSSSVEHWFRSQVSAVVDDVLLDPSARYAELLDPASSVVPLLHEHPRSYRSSKFLLSVLMLELWLTRYLPRASTPAGVRRAA